MKKLLTILILLCSLSSFGQFGLFQAHNRYSIVQIKNGYLYNAYAFTNGGTTNLANDGWHIPTSAELTTLSDFLGADAGGKLKQTGVVYWDSPNEGATNETKFNSRGSGRRSADGTFSNKNRNHYILSSTFSGSYPIMRYTLYNSASFVGAGTLSPNFGGSIRLLKDSTTLSDGESGTYTGNDGKVYRTVCIGTQEWVADNIAETKYRNGDPIPEVTDGTTWAGLTTGARCVYGNDENNR